MTDKKLVQKAKEAAEKSYCPYSHFSVGAALMTKSGKVFQGCNIENASFSPTCCAERTAFFKAISEGERDFLKIAIVGGSNGSFTDYCTPCGVCRQVMAEFCDRDFTVILGKDGDEIKSFSLGELLPQSFGLK